MEVDLGPGQNVFKQFFNNLKINCSQYLSKSVGGLLERNQVQNIINKAREDQWKMLEAIKDKAELIEKDKEAIKCLAQVDIKLKREKHNFIDEGVKQILYKHPDAHWKKRGNKAI